MKKLFADTNAPYYALLAALVAVYDSSIAALFLRHCDIGWHIAAGDLILKSGAIPTHDPWSFTAGNQPWYEFSWAWDIMASLLYKAAGLNALVMATILQGSVIAVLMLSIGLYCGASAPIAALCAFAASILFPIYAPPDIFLAVAPQIFTLLFSLVFYLLLLKQKHLWLLPLVLIVWANLHGGFLAGFIIVGTFGLEALINKRWKYASYLAGIGIACVLFSLITPFGIGIYQELFALTMHFHRKYVSEWAHYWTVLSWPESLLPVTYMVIFLLTQLTTPPTKSSLAQRFMLWFWLVLGLYQLRYLTVFFVLSAPCMAVDITERYKQRLHSVVLARPFLWTLSILFIVCIPYMYMQVFPQRAQFDPEYYPVAEVAYIEAHYPHARVFNHWNYGGYMILNSDLAVFVDGRASIAYPDDVLKDFGSLLSEEIHPRDWDAVLQKYHPDVILWPAFHTEAEEFLVGKRGWNKVYSGPVATVYAKVPPHE